MIRTLRTIRWVTLGLIVVAAVGMAVLKFRPVDEPADHDASAGTVSVPAGVAIGGPFHLTDDKGHQVTDANYRGRWMLVFFGYTNCPDECPLTLQKMATALVNIGPLA
jgi:protein SCO1/2